MRYVIEQNAAGDGWVATDTVNLIVAQFTQGNFNGTQRITLLDESLITPAQLPRLLRELGDWLAANHPDKI